MTSASLTSRSAERPSTALASADGAAKVRTFLDTVRTDQMAFNWELTMTVGGRPTVLQFTGGRASDGNLFIIGANDARRSRSTVR